ncbi:unnamed protein product [Schistosoma margrebowiei]|uniref:Uncharacterized protein n=1 Tax=Schistosoma margrebowiei TaxID=48269 RepID=A0A183MN79_9TREM|nr:unnamed protein product [Schistosoma margrebowiei]
MESSRPKEKRKTKEHMMPGNGDKHGKNEQELDGIKKEGPGQSGLENSGRWPMLHQDNLMLKDYETKIKQHNTSQMYKFRLPP